MTVTIDARGLSCPQPVVLTKKALELHDVVEVLVDNKTAQENVSRFAGSSGCSCSVEEKDGGIYALRIENDKNTLSFSLHQNTCSGAGRLSPGGELVVAICDERMGRGDDELGRLLARSFLHTMTEMDDLPERMVFYNSGVRLAVSGSAVVEDLKALEGRGVDLMVCGTCLDYFGLTDKLAAGRVSNMYDIAGSMTRASRLVMP